MSTVVCGVDEGCNLAIDFFELLDVFGDIEVKVIDIDVAKLLDGL